MFKDILKQANKLGISSRNDKGLNKNNPKMVFMALCLLFVYTNGMAQFGTTSDLIPGPLPEPAQLDDPYNNAGQVGYCLATGGSNSCTANDFTITSLTTLNVDDGCTGPDDYMQIDLAVTFAKERPTRYDVGAWFYRGPEAGTGVSFNAENAITGSFCTRVGVEAGLLTPDGDLTVNDAADNGLCIDVPAGTPGNLTSQTLTNLVLPCRDVVPLGNLDGITDISACTTWQNSSGSNCQGPVFQEFDLAWPNSPFATEIQPQTGSKCNCGEFDGGPLLVQVPDIEITKVCTPTELAPGDPTTCTITITNTGIGDLLGATSEGVEGFFYQDNYPEGQGSVSNIIITSGVAEDDYYDFYNDANTDQAINIYPGTISGPTGVVTVTYTFTTNASLPVTLTDITNTVCTASYNDEQTPSDLTDDEIFIYDDATNCATQIITTPVSISSFKANVSKLNNGYDFTWSTETETGNLGFNIYAIVGQTRFKLNDELIPSSVIDSMNKQDYSYQIDSQFNGLAKKFIIEDVDRLGRKHSNGVYKLGQQHGVIEDESMLKDTDWYSINQEFDKTVKLNNKNLSGVVNKQMRTAKDSQQKSSQEAINVLMNVAQTGIYKVSYQDLSQLGLDLSNLKSDTISVALNGELIPLDMHVDMNTNQFNQDSYFQFYAINAESLYTDENVYTLNLNASQASPEMQVVSSPPRGNSFTGSYEKTVKLNRNQAYSFSSPVVSDPWYDTRLLAIRSPSTSYINLTAKNRMAGDAKLSLVYWGGLDFEDDNLDHAIDFKINGTELGSDTFDGITLREKSYTFSDDLLKDSNEIEMVLPAQTLNKVDLINLESVSLSYPSRFVASYDQLTFQHDGANFNVENLLNPDVSVFALQGNDIVQLKNFKSKKQHNLTYNIQFNGVKGGAEYFVIAKDKIATPLLQLSQAKDVSLAATEHLIISHGNFIGHYLTTYAEATREDYRIVDVADIYHLYSDNRPDGEAIKSFIADVAANGDLKSVLLVGGDSYDYKNYTGLDSISFVPTIYRATDEIIKFSAVDALFGDIDNDNIPEVAVGRLPVRTLDELKTIIDKSNLYTSHNGELSAVLAADDSESLSAYQFTSVSNLLANQLTDDDWYISTAYLDEKTIEDSRQDLINAMNDGVRLAIYTGHSSSKSWSFEGLFKSTDIDTLTNTDDPFGVVQWGCWNTYFVDPKEDSLGHEFMLSGNRGAAFVLGASTLTDATQESYFANIFNNYILSDGESIGSAMIKAKQEFAANRSLSHKDILWGVTILGDPLIQVK